MAGTEKTFPSSEQQRSFPPKEFLLESFVGQTSLLGKFAFPYFFWSFWAQTLGIWPLIETLLGPCWVAPSVPRYLRQKGQIGTQAGQNPSQGL